MPEPYEHYLENPDAYMALTDEEKAAVENSQALTEGDSQGAAAQGAGVAPQIPETGADKATGGSPDPGTAAGNPDILAKDGKSTIPFTVLEEARHKAAEWQQLAAQQQQLIADLQKAQQADAGTGTTEAQDAVLAEYQGEFPEIADDLMPHVKTLIEKGIKDGLAAFASQIEQRVAPIEQSSQQAQVEQHFNTILAAHPAFESDLASDGFKAWFDGLTPLVQSAYRHALEHGTASQVIEVFDSYGKVKGRADNGRQTAKAKADSVIAATAKPPPGSMSDFPAGSQVAVDEVEALMNASPEQLVAQFQGKSEAEVNRILARLG